MQIRYVGLSNETPYGIMKFVQEAERDPRNPKIISVQVVNNSFLVQNIAGVFFFCPLSLSLDSWLMQPVFYATELIQLALPNF